MAKRHLATAVLCVSTGLLILSLARAGEIHDAAEAGDLAKVQSILDNDASQANAKTEFTKETPLNMAARKCRKEVVELLLDKGADVNAKDEDWATRLCTRRSNASRRRSRAFSSRRARR